MSDLPKSASVQRVEAALKEAGSPARIVLLDRTARSAREAADSVGCPLGAIVKSLVFTIGGRPVLVLVAGDRQCMLDHLAGAFDLAGEVDRPDAATVREATGFAIGGVSPVGLTGEVPIRIDASLRRFDTVYAAAGHPHCVFAIAPDELARITGAPFKDDVAG
jgi:prolyl-tRNA editing enzyme YbaK/EbsC (Cys-tRNA(Pro) deacylase)